MLSNLRSAQIHSTSDSSIPVRAKPELPLIINDATKRSTARVRVTARAQSQTWAQVPKVKPSLSACAEVRERQGISQYSNEKTANINCQSFVWLQQFPSPLLILEYIAVLHNSCVIPILFIFHIVFPFLKRCSYYYRLHAAGTVHIYIIYYWIEFFMI